MLKMGWVFLGVQVKPSCGGRRRGTLSCCLCALHLLHVWTLTCSGLECFHEALQPVLGCAGCTFSLENAKVQGIVSWFVSCSSCGWVSSCSLKSVKRCNCLYLLISAFCWKSLCVHRPVGVNCPNSLQRKSNGLAKTEHVNCWSCFAWSQWGSSKQSLQGRNLFAWYTWIQICLAPVYKWVVA